MSRDDEIGGRGDRDSFLTGRARVALVLAALTLAALVGLPRLGGGHEPDRPPTPSPTSLLGEVPPPTPATLDWVRVASVCPVESDRRRWLTVRFMLENSSRRPVTIEALRAVVRTGALRPRSTWVGGGDCHRLAPQVGAGPVPPGGQRLAMLRFRLSRACPGPVSLAARARMSRDGITRRVDLPTLVILSAADFDGCRSPG